MVQLFCGTTVMYILRWVHMYFSLGLCYVRTVPRDASIYIRQGIVRNLQTADDVPESVRYTCHVFSVSFL